MLIYSLQYVPQHAVTVAQLNDKPHLSVKWWMGFFVVCRKVRHISVAQICVLSVFDGLPSTFIYLYTCSRTVSHSDDILRLLSGASLMIVLIIVFCSMRGYQVLWWVRYLQWVPWLAVKSLIFIWLSIGGYFWCTHGCTCCEYFELFWSSWGDFR